MTTLALKINTAAPHAATIRTANAAPRPARRVFPWELAGVLSLMASSAAVALFTLAHLA